MQFTSASVTVFAVLLFPSLALAAPQTFSELVELLISIINIATPILLGAAIALFLFNTTKGIFTTAQGSGNNTESRKALLWGLVILFVMVSLWGILNIIRATFLD